MDADDATLAARIAAGDDRDAESTFARRWFPRVRAYGRLHVAAPDAADFAQEVIVIVLQALRERRAVETGRLPAYVSGVSRNVARDWSKGERRRGALMQRFGTTDTDFIAAPPATPEPRLADCLKKLSVRDRSVVVLTFCAEKDGDEISRELSMSAGNVRVARFRALKQLLGCLEGSA